MAPIDELNREVERKKQKNKSKKSSRSWAPAIRWM